MARWFLVSLLLRCLLILCTGMLLVNHTSCIAAAGYVPHTIHFSLRPKYMPTQRIVSAATLHPRRSEVNSGQCTPIQPDSAHFWTFTYGCLPKFLPKQFLYIMDTPDSILVSVAAEMVAFE